MSKKNKSQKQSINLVIDEETERSLKIIADRLPPIPIETKDGEGIPEYRKMFGHQLIEDGHTEINGQKIRPGKCYSVRANKKQVANINHFEEVKKAFLRNGLEGVNKYMAETNLKIK